MYFDQIDEERFGTIRQQIWTVAHLPLHLAILLVIEGARSFATWDVGYRLFLGVINVENTLPPADTSEQLLSNAQNVFGYYASLLGTTPPFNVTTIYDEITRLNDSDPNWRNKATNYSETLVTSCMGWVAEAFEWFSEEDLDKASEDQEKLLDAVETKALAMFRYFFVAAGLTLVFLAVLHWLGKTHKRRGELLSITVSALVGVILSLLTLFSLGATNEGAGGANFFWNYLQSTWITPTVLLIYVAGK